jgi:hypothetical protein
MSGKTAHREISTELIAQLRVAHTAGSYYVHVCEYAQHVDSGPVLCKPIGIISFRDCELVRQAAHL